MNTTQTTLIETNNVPTSIAFEDLKNNKDLKFFADKFDCTHSKFLSNGLEVRVLNLEVGKYDALKFIKQNKLKLDVVTEGNMVMLRAFLVKPI